MRARALGIAALLAACASDPAPITDAGGTVDTGSAPCGGACGAGTVCASGRCMALDAGSTPDTGAPVDANSTVDSGSVPDSGLPPGCTSTTVGNCCGVACRIPPHATTAACIAGRCAAGGCETGYSDCDGDEANGCEVDTRASNAHCGACNAPCAAGRGCVSGACLPCDNDNDGAMSAACGGNDCDDNDAASHPGAVEVCDGHDTDCNGHGDAEDAAILALACNALTERTVPTVTWTGPATCTAMVSPMNRPASLDRYTMACRRCYRQLGMTVCACFAADGSSWACD